ncbi:MAG: YchJ family protein [Sulfuricellaceae bacterium]|jgi:SEC-C motif-containing protein
MTTPCPCGSGKAFEACCGPYLAGAPAPTPEALMRSRYTAYTLGDKDYLERTWHPSTRPADLELEKDVKWLGLKVVEARGGEQDETGTVRFVARFKVGGRGHRMEETSRFVREAGRWFYLDGDVS